MSDMEIMNYLKAASNAKSPFYEDASKKVEKGDNFQIPKVDKTIWRESEDKDWHYVMLRSKKEAFPEQGWKIHITANIADARELLYDVAEYLLLKEISFKYIPDLNELVLRNSKYADRTESGKFITVYPASTHVFETLLDDLKDIADLYKDGPYILNDKQWKDSNIFFRYGAFQLFFTDEGEPAIKDNDGKLIPDKRVPYYYLPDFVNEPVKVIKENFQPQDQEFDYLKKFTGIKAIHFSNSGGVYEAKMDEKLYILKEGRPYAGVDANLLDGFERIKKEFRFLKRLDSVSGVVKVHECFTIWKHAYICEDKVPGVTLNDYVATRYPFSRSLLSSESDYVQNAMKIVRKLENIIKEVHARGVAIGDIQPTNVLYSEESGTVTLIDFENSAETNVKYLPGLKTPNFAPEGSMTFSQADWYAFKQIVYSLFVPNSISNKLVSDIDLILLHRARERFDNQVIEFLMDVNVEVARHISTANIEYDQLGITVAPEELNMNSFSAFISGLKNGIVNNFDREGTGLIKGIPAQHRNEVSEYSVNYGAFGGLMGVLRSSDNDDLSEVKGWLLKVMPRLLQLGKSVKSDIGLFSGISGICSVLYDMGFEKEALQLLNSIKVDLKANDLSLYSGLCGIGLNDLSFYTMTNEKGLLFQAKDIADVLIQKFNTESKRHSITQFDLMDGLAGEALFLLALSRQDTTNLQYNEIAVKMMDYVLKYGVFEDDFKTLQVIDESADMTRLLPYLSNGSVGIALVMIEIAKDNKDYLQKRQVEFKKLVDASYVFSSAEGGLFTGYSGFVVLGNAMNSIKHDSSLLEYSLKGLNPYIVGDGINEMYLPSLTGLKCSMDLEYGSAGTLLAFSDINTDRWNAWLPYPLVTS